MGYNIVEKIIKTHLVEGEMIPGEEIALREAASAARKEHGFADDTALHLDIPLTEAHTTALLYEAGFTEVKRILAKGRTTVLIAKK